MCTLSTACCWHQDKWLHQRQPWKLATCWGTKASWGIRNILMPKSSILTAIWSVAVQNILNKPVMVNRAGIALPRLTPGVLILWLNSFDRHFQSVLFLLLNMFGKRRLVICKHYLRSLIQWNKVQGFSIKFIFCNLKSIKPRIFKTFLSFPQEI